MLSITLEARISSVSKKNWMNERSIFRTENQKSWTDEIPSLTDLSEVNDEDFKEKLRFACR